ncbi:MAG: hypothetical protein AAGA48_40085 [Myxococcota bacterium]
MNFPFSGAVLSWSHQGRVLVIDVHPESGPPLTPDGPLVEWEALARYLSEGADGARALVVCGDHGIDAGLCWSSLSGQVDTAWSGLPGFVSRRGAAGDMSQLIGRVTAVWQAIARFEGPTLAVVSGACVRGGFEVVAAVDEVVAERRPGLDERLRMAGVHVDRWVDPGEGRSAVFGRIGVVPPASRHRGGASRHRVR